MKLDPVQSTSIKAIGHDAEKNELHVQFHSGATHVYSGVDASKHSNLVNADSIGSHFHHNIKAHANRKL